MVLTLLITAGSIMRATEQCVGLGITVQWGTWCLLSCQVSGSIWSEVCSFVLILVMESEYKLYVTGKEEDRKKGIRKVMVISFEVVPCFCLSFSCKENDEITKFRSKKKIHVSDQTHGDSGQNTHLKIQILPALLCIDANGNICSAYSGPDCFCFFAYALYAYVKQGTIWGSLVFSVFRGIEIEIAFSSLGVLYQMVIKIVRFIKRKNITSKTESWSSEVSQTPKNDAGQVVTGAD